MQVIQDISLDRIADLLIGAFEGGSNYWYQLDEKITPKNWNFLSKDRPEKIPYWYYEYPLNEGGALIISVPEDEDGATYTLNLEKISSGLQIFADKYPEHYADFIGENEDGTTSDIFLQCCLFNDVIYG